MGVECSVGMDRFPKQGEMLGKRCRICFDYDSSRYVLGLCIRDDVEDPHKTIFQLPDGRIVFATECHYQLPDQLDQYEPLDKGWVKTQARALDALLRRVYVKPSQTGAVEGVLKDLERFL